MTPFEYVTVPVSIVLALGLGRVLTAIVELFERGTRDWVRILWCASLVGVMLGQWLAVWRLQPNVVWEAYEFYIVMFSPILYFSAAHILVPANVDSVPSWEEHLLKVARPLLILMMLSILNFWLRNYLILGSLRLEPMFIGIPLVIFAIHAAAIWRPNRTLLAVCGFLWFIPMSITVAFVEIS